MSTGALFRTEVGGEPDDTGRRHLTDVEYGLALSYALSDRVSGAPTYVWPFSHPEGWLPEIRAAVEAGQISDPDVVDNLVRLYAGGHDPGDLPADADPDETPAEIEALNTPETRVRTPAQWPSMEAAWTYARISEHRVVVAVASSTYQTN